MNGIGLPGSTASSPNSSFAVTGSDGFCSARVSAFAPPPSVLYQCPATRTLATVSAGWGEDPSCRLAGAPTVVSAALLMGGVPQGSAAAAALSVLTSPNISSTTAALLQGNCVNRVAAPGAGTHSAVSCYSRVNVVNGTTQ